MKAKVTQWLKQNEKPITDLFITCTKLGVLWFLMDAAYTIGYQAGQIETLLNVIEQDIDLITKAVTK